MCLEIGLWLMHNFDGNCQRTFSFLTVFFCITASQSLIVILYLDKSNRLFWWYLKARLITFYLSPNNYVCEMLRYDQFFFCVYALMALHWILYKIIIKNGLQLLVHYNMLCNKIFLRLLCKSNAYGKQQ